MRRYGWFLTAVVAWVGGHVRAQGGFYVSFDSTRIHYERTGAGEAVLLIHGFTNDGNSWKNSSLYDDLVRAGFEVVLVDLRGNGQSDKPHACAAYENDAEVKDLMGLMTALNISHYHMVGYSRGSIIAARLLVLDGRVGRAVLGGMGEGFTDPAWPRRILFYEALMGKPVEELEPFLERIQAIGLDRRVLACQQWGQPFTSPEELAKVKCPVLVICGDRDGDNGSGKTLSRMIPGSRFVEVDGDHGTARRTAAFGSAVTEFLMSR